MMAGAVLVVARLSAPAMASAAESDDGGPRDREPEGMVTASVSAGELHTCAMRTDGTLSCWGYNGYGAASPPAGTFVQMSAGAYHACGVRTDHTLSCWGDNAGGESSPPAGTFTEVSGGFFHTCGVRTDGTLACWGYDV